MSAAELPMVFVLVGLVFYVVLGRRGLRRGDLAVRVGRGERGERHPRARPRGGRARVGGQPRLADLRADRDVDRLPGGLRLDGLDAVRGAVRRRAGDHRARRGLRAAQRHHGPRARSAASTRASAVSSVLTPFALGAAIGGAGLRAACPSATPQGDLITSWLNPTSIFIGALAVAFCAYLAAVYLAADAARRGEPTSSRPSARARWGPGLVAGVLAVAGLVVLHHDAYRLYHELSTVTACPR